MDESFFPVIYNRKLRSNSYPFTVNLQQCNEMRSMAIKRLNKYTEVPEVVILRLPLYVRVLTKLDEDRETVISSYQLGQLLQMTPAQIRKDLSYFGRFGKQGRGYNIRFLLEELKHILEIDKFTSPIVSIKSTLYNKSFNNFTLK